MDKKIHLPAFVIKSEYRKDVLLKLIEHPNQTQTQLKELTSPKYRSHMSRTMKELSEHNLITCHNPEDHSYKIYFPTTIGIQVGEEIESYKKTKNDKTD
jgi:predicted transcriptional regulator